MKRLTKNQQDWIGVYIFILFWTIIWWYIGSEILWIYLKESVYLDLILGAWWLTLFAVAAIEWPILQYFRRERAKLLREDGLDENYQRIK